MDSTTSRVLSPRKGSLPATRLYTRQPKAQMSELNDLTEEGWKSSGAYKRDGGKEGVESQRRRRRKEGVGYV